MQGITPFLWFNDDAEEAIDFYVSLFPDARILSMNRLEGGPTGSVVSASFELQGQQFMAINGGPMYTFSEATSFLVSCDTQQEIDHLWEKLSEGGEKQQCGWLRDRFGVTWQIVPAVLGQLIGGSDPAKAKRATEAMLQMQKLDIAALQRAYDAPVGAPS